MRAELVVWAQEALQRGSPPMLLLIGVGLVIVALTAGALRMLTLTLPSLKGLPSRALALAVAYNALIVGVKFVLAPLGFYQTNKETDFESFFGLGGLIFAGAGSALLMYFLVLLLIYWIQKRSLRASLDDDSGRQKSRLRKGAVIGIFAGVIVLTGGGLLFIAYLAAFDALQYLSFVLSSVFGVLIVLMLVGATVLAARTFRSAAEHAAAVGNAAVLACLFWVAACLLAGYHALWIVFVLMLNSVWPLRVVVPK